ncbi:HD domain-containing protein [Gottschalkiaceae bacterium SANA]|nr:HD domain-containing protein [Gottschalkiaceae bacterium SANA]
MRKMNNVYQSMISFYAGDPKRIQHFVKVHSFAKLIGELEKLDECTQEILEVTAYVHDIGIKIAKIKHGHCTGKLQEEEGAVAANLLLTQLGYDQELIERVSYIVGHHHTYSNIDGMDYQILVEADFLVNMYENKTSEESVISAYQKIFKTESGKDICKTMFGSK